MQITRCALEPSAPPGSIDIRLTAFEATALLHALQAGRPHSWSVPEEREAVRTLYQSLMALVGAPSAAETARIEGPFYDRSDIPE